MRIIRGIKRRIFEFLLPIKYKRIIKKQKIIRHALGGIDNYDFTNCKEALEKSYNLGFRLFEVDIRKSSDGILILMHGGWQKRLGLNEEIKEIDSKTFLESKIHKKYTTMSFKDLADFMKVHKDMYVMLDVGSRNYDSTVSFYKRIVKDCNKDYTILRRFIVGGHNVENINAIKSVYRFLLFNLYCPNESKRCEELNTSEKLINYCKENGIMSISMPLSDYNEEVINLAHKNNILVYCFTINEYEEANELLKTVDIIGTDYLDKIK